MPPGFSLSGAARGVMRKSVSLAIPSPLKSTEASRPTARSHQTEHDFGRHYSAWLVSDECNVNPDCRMVIVIEKTQRRAAQAITECLALVSFTVFRYFERSEFPSLRRTGLFTTQKELIKEGGGEALLRGLSYRGRQV
ncbi:hypothetical protein HZ326_6932 [Fusarium oxysporum f. sp. albedinis]|nr:hypothetical protein HZ326_6932 [Fusarium oxysporum f. sp. albedinis]